MLSKLKRLSIVIVHRRAGKTVAAVAKLCDSALRCTKIRGRYAYIAPELKQAKRVAWDYLKAFAGRVPGTKINESETWVEFPNGARVGLYGADAPDSLRGTYLDGVVLDEVAQMKAPVWGEIIVPQLTDRQGWALFIGTPKGINLLSEIFFRALKDPTWYADKLDYTQTNALSESQLAEMRAEMTEQQWRQEMRCDFDASPDESLMSIDLVKGSMGKHLRVDEYNFAPRVLGVDVARQGSDRTVIQPRQGLAAFEAIVRVHSRIDQTADAVIAKIDTWGAQSVQVDGTGGYGAGVIDRLIQLRYDVMEVQFGAMPRDARFANKRTEMWWDVKEWLERGGALPDIPDYLKDLTGPRYDHKNAAGKLALESKESMERRGIRSPDYGDALACSFAYPVSMPERVDDIFGRRLGIMPAGASSRSKTDYNPLDRE
jgi:hypothetical protein